MTVFGRGRGEALAVHLGHGHWATVDCFIDPATREPVVLAYLRSLGVGPEAVKIIVATHWDDDHIGGLTRVAQASPQARVVVSAALRSRDLLRRIHEHQKRTMGGALSSGTREFVRLTDQLRRDGRKLETAHADKVLWDRAGVRLAALAPSQRTADLATSALLSLFDQAQTGDAVRDVAPNATSIVLALQATAPAALLGGDLEASPHPDAGWRAVVGCELARGLSVPLFKVPHHGSPDADDPHSCAAIVQPGAYHAVTRFNNGSRSRPSAEDRRRLVSRGAIGRVIGAPTSRRRVHGVVGRRVRAATIDGLWTATGPVGQITWRASIGPAFDVEPWHSGATEALAASSAP